MINVALLKQSGDRAENNGHQESFEYDESRKYDIYVHINVKYYRLLGDN